MTRTRLTPNDRKPQLLEAAVAVAVEHGLQATTRALIATRAGVAPGLITHYLGTMAELRRAVMRQAVKQEILPIIASGLAARDKQALKAPPEVRARALASLQ